MIFLFFDLGTYLSFSFLRTHRHPVSSVPSLCSLIKSVHQVYYENECRDDRAIGKNIAEISSRYLVQGTRDLETTKLGNSHVIYENLVKDPVETVKSIYKQHGWNFSAEYEKILNAYLEENRLKREATKKERQSGDVLHSYTPEEFSLTTEELCQGNFAEYCKQYNVPMSRN